MSLLSAPYRKWIFLGLLLLLLGVKYKTYTGFASKYTDNDQSVLWLTAEDMKNGEFYAPCFYGQAYNPNLEPLLAVPLLLVGMEHYLALPLVTMFLGILPFLLLSYFLALNQERELAFLPLIIALLLPLQYDMITSMPRGFVGGIASASLGLVLLLFQKSRFFKVLGGFLLGLSLYLNPNALFLFPFLIPVVFKDRRNIRAHLTFTLPGFILGAGSLLLNSWFYQNNPELVIHPNPNLTLSFDIFLKVLGSLDHYFDFVAPVFWKGGWISLFTLSLASWYLRRKQQKLQAAIILGLFLLLILSFSMSKVEDATNSIYFTGSRMYLAYPICLILILCWVWPLLKPRLKTRLSQVLLSLAVLSGIIKIWAFDAILQHEFRGSAYSVVQVASIDKLKSACQEYQNFSKKPVDLIMSYSSSDVDQNITYGCPCLEPDFPPTFQARYERRTWQTRTVLESDHKRILLHGADTSIRSRLSNTRIQVLKSRDTPHLLLIDNPNDMPALIETMGLHSWPLDREMERVKSETCPP